MKAIAWNKIIHVLGVSSATLALTLTCGCVVRPYGEVDYVPDDYVWDGYEYVGVVGDQYYYLGPGNVWIVCDPVRLRHFHAYVRIHPDWHVRAIHNDHFRRDFRGREHPRRVVPAHPVGHSHDYDHDHDGDSDHDH